MTAASAHVSPFRHLHAELLGFERQRVAIISIVIAGDDMPEIIMFNGNPFLRDPGVLGTAYRQVRPFRADVGA